MKFWTTQNHRYVWYVLSHSSLVVLNKYSFCTWAMSAIMCFFGTNCYHSSLRQNTFDEFGKASRLGGHVVLNSGFHNVDNIIEVYIFIVLSFFGSCSKSVATKRLLARHSDPIPSYLLLCVHVCTRLLFSSLKWPASLDMFAQLLDMVFFSPYRCAYFLVMCDLPGLQGLQSCRQHPHAVAGRVTCGTETHAETLVNLWIWKFSHQVSSWFSWYFHLVELDINDINGLTGDRSWAPGQGETLEMFGKHGRKHTENTQLATACWVTSHLRSQ